MLGGKKQNFENLQNEPQIFPISRSNINHTLTLWPQQDSFQFINQGLGLWSDLHLHGNVLKVLWKDYSMFLNLQTDDQKGDFFSAGLVKKKKEETYSFQKRPDQMTEPAKLCV